MKMTPLDIQQQKFRTRQRVQIEMEISTIIESHAKMLEISNERMQALDAADGKLKILKQAKL